MDLLQLIHSGLVDTSGNMVGEYLTSVIRSTCSRSKYSSLDSSFTAAQFTEDHAIVMHQEMAKVYDAM